MKKTPFCIVVCLMVEPLSQLRPGKWTGFSSALSYHEAAEISLHSHKKGLSQSSMGWTDPLVGAVPGRFKSARWRRLWLLVHSCRSANAAITALRTGGCASIKRRDNVTHKFIIALL